MKIFTIKFLTFNFFSFYFPKYKESEFLKVFYKVKSSFAVKPRKSSERQCKILQFSTEAFLSIRRSCVKAWKFPFGWMGKSFHGIFIDHSQH